MRSLVAISTTSHPIFAEELHARFAYWREKGIDGLSVRIDRETNPELHHDWILYEVQESNLWCLGRWMTDEASDIDEPLIEWATERFGAVAAPEIARIARLCDPVIAEALTVCGEPFGDTRQVAPEYAACFPFVKNLQLLIVGLKQKTTKTLSLAG
jgi:hypothetical protein